MLLIAVFFAELAELAGLHSILGAFLAGLFLREFVGDVPWVLPTSALHEVVVDSGATHVFLLSGAGETPRRRTVTVTSPGSSGASRAPSGRSRLTVAPSEARIRSRSTGTVRRRAGAGVPAERSIVTVAGCATSEIVVSLIGVRVRTCTRSSTATCG